MNLQAFMKYMKEQFPEPLNNHFCYSLLENIVQDVCTQYGEEIAPNVLYNIIPEIEKQELAQFFTTEEETQ